MIYFVVAMGTLFCAFWVVQIVFVRLHIKWSNTQINSNEQDISVPVSVIHPIKDLDFEVEKNLESWMDQNYKGAVQHVFSFQDPSDPAIKVVERLIKSHPSMDMVITVNPVSEGLNGKSSNMVNGMKLAKYDIVMFGDSDVRIKPDFILKMARPLKDERIGIVTCGQTNIGGRDFWTRFFTFTQNTETDFMWALFTKLGIDVGATGAAFSMRKALLKQLGGLEAFGGSLLEDLHLGNTLYKMGYKLLLGPFVECHVDKLGRERSFNYAKRIASGIKTHIAIELPAFVLMLSWYWILFALALILQNSYLLFLSLSFIGFRSLHGVATRIVTKNKVFPIDFIMAPLFDLFGTFFLVSSFKESDVTWRGIKYEVGAGGFIQDVDLEAQLSKKLEAELIEEHAKD